MYNKLNVAMLSYLMKNHYLEIDPTNGVEYCKLFNELIALTKNVSTIKQKLILISEYIGPMTNITYKIYSDIICKLFSSRYGRLPNKDERDLLYFSLHKNFFRRPYST